jgi:hypothetical protein
MYNKFNTDADFEMPIFRCTVINFCEMNISLLYRYRRYWVEQAGIIICVLIISAQFYILYRTFFMNMDEQNEILITRVIFRSIYDSTRNFHL